MVNKKSWKQFRDCGMLWWINMILQLWGGLLYMSLIKMAISQKYPARVKFRGFGEQNNTDGYIKVSQYMKENADDLLEEVLN